VTTATEVNLSDYTGKKVIVTQNLDQPDKDGNTAIEVEGTVQVGNSDGVLIKPKGKATFDLIEARSIEDIRLAPEKDKSFKASKLKLVTIGSARRHLLERHGVTLAWANSVSEEQALEYHNSLNHEELDLGHVHTAKADKSEESE
jgi:hypothetical protein